LGDSLSKRITDPQLVDVDTPFGPPSDKILVGYFGNCKIAFLNRHGPGHKFPPSLVPFQANVFALKKLGVTTLLCLGAVGSLSEHIHPGDLCLVDQFIDKTYKRANSFFLEYGAVHVELADPACMRLRELLKQVAQSPEFKSKCPDHTVHSEGTYVVMEGPAFSTRAESLMHRAWGGNLIGMTAMPEAKLAREAQMCYALIALVSDYDCWHPHEVAAGADDKKVLLKEIIANMNCASKNAVELIEAVLTHAAAAAASNEGDAGGDKKKEELSNSNCICRKSLELAVWTHDEAIPVEQKEQMKVLFE